MSQDGGQGAAADAGTQGSGGTDDLDAIRRRMDEIKAEAAADVDKNWGSVYRTKEVFDLKVNSRLAANEEYRALMEKVRAAGSGN